MLYSSTVTRKSGSRSCLDSFVSEIKESTGRCSYFGGSGSVSGFKEVYELILTLLISLSFSPLRRYFWGILLFWLCSPTGYSL
jgi:hypothetical protein